MKLLRLTPALKSTSASYNQFSIGFKDTIDQTVCSLHEYHDVLIDKKIKVFHGQGSIFKMMFLIKRLIRKNKYDIVHIHNGLTGIIFILAIFPFRLNLLKRTVFTLHNSWNVLTLRNQFLDFIVMLASKKICTCGLSSLNSIPRWINFFIGYKTQPVVNGFDHNRIDNVETSRITRNNFDSNSKLKILCVGALNDTKNQIGLLEVLNHIKIEAELIFLGDGKNKKNLISFSKGVQDSIKIKFKGLVSRDLTIEHMLDADVCISLSKGEGLPIAVLEAMYSGCFMILSDIPPHKEVSPPQERCIFVDIYDANEIIRSLNFVIKNIEKIKDRRGISKKYSISKFGVHKMLSAYKEVYDSLS